MWLIKDSFPLWSITNMSVIDNGIFSKKWNSVATIVDIGRICVLAKLIKKETELTLFNRSINYRICCSVWARWVGRGRSPGGGGRSSSCLPSRPLYDQVFCESRSIRPDPDPNYYARLGSNKWFVAKIVIKSSLKALHIIFSFVERFNTVY